MQEVMNNSKKSNPTEKRLATRESLRYYNAIVVAGIYQLPKDTSSSDASQREYYFPALRACVQTHPMLTTVVKDVGSSDERYVQVQAIDLHNHVNLLHPVPHLTSDTEDDQIGRILEHIHNEPELAMFNRSPDVPRWRIDFLPLDAKDQRVFISFTYSHCVGDGMSGAIFHQTFLAALSERRTDQEGVVNVQQATLPVLPKLPVSLSFLLAPALGHYLPRFLSNFFGLKASASGSDPETWLGANFFDDRLSPDRCIQTAVEVFSLDHDTLAAVLKACRTHQTRLTALLNETIALCFNQRLPHYSAAFAQKTNLISCVPTNFRKTAGVPSDAMGNIAGAAYSRHPISRMQNAPIDEELWSRARIQSALIARSVASLKNQVTGLLAWISNMRTWMEGELGQARDSSWQLSNLMAVNGGEGATTIEKMFFCQSGDVVGQPIDFNTVSVKGGHLVICAAWQVGALALDPVETTSVEGSERKLVTEILQDLKAHLKVIAES